ncbi:site-specific DNA-methyltransferase [Thalassobius sp. I31.1]|uniref:DNA-methyltransferase n=1 Tax=Thalassobius sp. I31.1 TaxID=2109912 RepID=UPI0013003E70|nr:site-specific DNA-methyltransferase [Thalassobius sp. I31.1]
MLDFTSFRSVRGVFHVGDVTLIHGDMLDVLPELQLAADLLVTDPPYKLTSGGKNVGKGMSGKFDSEVYDNSGFLMKTVAWSHLAPPIYRALKPRADAYVMADDKNIFAAHDAFLGAGFRYHSLLDWDKITPSRTPYYMKNKEQVLFLYKGKARYINNGGSKRSFPCPRPDNAIHPTQKPLELLRHYIENSSQPGDLVLDPFAGSASTLIAAAQSRRRAIGIELSEEYFQAACQRLTLECGGQHA